MLPATVSQVDSGVEECSPLKQEKIDVVVFLREEVAKDAGGVAAADLIGREGEVDTLDKVPNLGHRVLAEHPVRTDMAILINKSTSFEIGFYNITALKLWTVFQIKCAKHKVG